MFKALGLAGLASLMLLMGCGGGGDSVAKFSGTVATGAPMVGATVEVYDASGALISTVTTDSKGRYLTPNLNNLTGPYVIKASLNGLTLYSVQATGAVATVNVTPLSNLVATLLSPTGNAANLSKEVAANKNRASDSLINNKKSIVSNIVNPVATVNGVGQFDVINTAMVADGTGLDQILDIVKISISNDDDASTIQVMYKLAGINSKPQIFTFKNSDADSKVIQSVNGMKYESKDVFDPTLMPKILAWINKLEACNKTPPTDRWEKKENAKVLISPVCKSIFKDDDPSKIYFNGGVPAEQLFTSFYGNIQYKENQISEPEYVYSTSAGEVMIKVKSKIINDDATSYYRYYFFNLTPNADKTELRYAGNNHSYETNVNAIGVINHFPVMPEYSYSMTGYQIDIPTDGTHSQGELKGIEYKDSTGNSISVKSAVVTAPTGQVTYMKNTGDSLLVACVDEAMTKCSQSPNRIVKSTFVDTDTGLTSTPPTDDKNLNRTRPGQYDFSGFIDYGDNGNLSDEAIQNLPMIGTFTIKLTMSNGSKATQYAPFFGRPKTNNEIFASKKRGDLPFLSSEFLKSLVSSNDDDVKGFFVLPVKIIDGKYISSPFQFAWTGMAQYTFMSGFNQYINGSGDTADVFKKMAMRSELLPRERTKEVACLRYSGDDPCYNNSSDFKFGQSSSGVFAVFDYFEIGNYFSDFGVNYSSYGFWDFNITRGLEKNTVTAD
jgi:hypothetical protein